MFRPEIVIGPGGPVVFHSDYNAVTAANPARAGEILIVYAKGLGPTIPSVNPGEPFPGEPYATATSPVEVLVDGKSSPAINKLGVPETKDTYRVDFQLPDETASGSASIWISAAWIRGGARWLKGTLLRAKHAISRQECPRWRSCLHDKRIRRAAPARR